VVGLVKGTQPPDPVLPLLKLHAIKIIQ